MGALVTGITHAIGRDSSCRHSSHSSSAELFAILMLGFGSMVGFISAKDAGGFERLFPDA